MTRASEALFGLALLCAAGDWLAVARGNKRLEHVFKPATMAIVIIAAGLVAAGTSEPWRSGWFIGGFALSLAGDVFLMLPGEGFFLPGLVAFLQAHVSYIAGLNPTLPPATIGVLLILAVIGTVGLALGWRIEAAMTERGQTRLRLPVAIYSLVISLMLFSAWATLLRADWTNARRIFVIVGATLFFTSDALLAWDRFVGSFGAARLAVIITYHLGQLALAVSLM